VSLTGRYVACLDRADREVVFRVVATAIAPETTRRVPAGEWSLLVIADDGSLQEIRASEARLLGTAETKRLIRNQRRRKASL